MRQQPLARIKARSLRAIARSPPGKHPRRRNTHQAGSQAGAPPHPHPLPQERGPAQERHQKTRRLLPRPLQTEVARTASGPPPLTRGHPRALLHMCRVSPLGRSASHGAPRHGAGGKQASSGTGRRDGVCGVQLERRRKRVSQAHPATEAPYKEGYRAGPLGTQQRNEYLHERGTEFELRNKDWCIRLRRRCRICGGARGAAVRVLDR